MSLIQQFNSFLFFLLPLVPPDLHNLHNVSIKTQNWKQSLNHWNRTSGLPLPPSLCEWFFLELTCCVCRQLISFLLYTATQFVRVSCSSTKNWNSLICANLCPRSCDTRRVLCCELRVSWDWGFFSHIWWTTASWKTGFGLSICIAELCCSVCSVAPGVDGELGKNQVHRNLDRQMQFQFYFIFKLEPHLHTFTQRRCLLLCFIHGWYNLVIYWCPWV